MKNKIGWCNTTWNPVWGCLNNCEYCYARKIAKFRYNRMIEIEFNHYWKKHPNWAWTGDYLSGLKDFKITFLEAQFDKKFPKKPQRIFVGSMSEIKYWKNEWMEDILEKIKLYPQHTFQFLTKFPGIYLWYKFPINCWLGITITDIKDYDYLEYQKFKISNPYNLKFVCFEPLLGEIDINLDNIDWVIIGKETGRREGKIYPKRHWIEKILIYCHKISIPVYVKDNIIKWHPVFKKYKEFPEIKL